MAGTYKSFEELDCWKAGKEARFFLNAVIKYLPKEERYMLANQIRRPSRSVINNIAEGFGRFHYQENIQFSSHHLQRA